MNKLDKDFTELIKQMTYNQNGAEYAWYFRESEKAFEQGLFLLSVCGALIGIEASLRGLIKLFDNIDYDDDKSIKKPKLNKKTLKKIHGYGLNIEVLCFPDDNYSQFMRNNNHTITIIDLRNELAHGNLFNYLESHDIQKPDQVPIKVFNPTFLKGLNQQLLEIQLKWANEINRFNKERRENAEHR